ncbi:MAG: hypothetical protein LBQ83_02680 [Candidatus Margulisbacteria bacterium]|jgi:hypothetical protein|nr:hypothetical protein [Candidatus Margulisiibacteriota bacterium]
MRKILLLFWSVLFLTGVLRAERFVMMPLWGDELYGIAQWDVNTVPLTIENIALDYAFDLAGAGARTEYEPYNFTMRIARIKHDFAPQSIEFLVQLYDELDKPILPEEGRILIARPTFSFFDEDESSKLTGILLKQKPAGFRIWVKSYIDENGNKVNVLKRWRKYPWGKDREPGWRPERGF